MAAPLRSCGLFGKGYICTPHLPSLDESEGISVCTSYGCVGQRGENLLIVIKPRNYLRAGPSFIYR